MEPAFYRRLKNLRHDPCQSGIRSRNEPFILTLLSLSENVILALFTEESTSKRYFYQEIIRFAQDDVVRLLTFRLLDPKSSHPLEPPTLSLFTIQDTGSCSIILADAIIK